MTLVEECEILCDVINSKIDRAEMRVHNWFPEMLHFKHYDEILELRNLCLHQFLHRRTVPAHLNFKSEDFRKWYKHTLEDLLTPLKYGNIYVAGRYNSVDSVVKRLDECIEFNEDIFK